MSNQGVASEVFANKKIMKSKTVSNSPPVYSLRRIRAYDKLKRISVTGVGQVRNNRRLQRDFSPKKTRWYASANKHARLSFSYNTYTSLT